MDPQICDPQILNTYLLEPLQDTRIARGDGGSVFVMVKELAPASPAFDFSDSSSTAIVSATETPGVVE